MAKTSEKPQIDFIVDCLRKGEQRKHILGKFGKKWVSVSRTTFDRRLREAEQVLQSELKAINKKAEERASEEAEARKTKILTVLERQEILAQIARGLLEIDQEVATATGVKLVKNKPDIHERIKAIAELNKMGGDYQPTKTDITSGGEKVIQWVMLPAQKSK